MQTFRIIAAVFFVLSCMGASYFFALQIPWLPLMCLFAAVGFLLMALSVVLKEDEDED